MTDRSALSNLQQIYYDHIAGNLPEVDPEIRLQCAKHYIIPHVFMVGTGEDT